MPDIGDDVLGFLGIGGTDNTDRFVEGDVEGLGFSLKGFSIDADDIAGRHPVARSGRLAIEGHPTGVDQPVRFPAGADAGLADVLVEADGVVLGCFQTKEDYD